MARPAQADVDRRAVHRAQGAGRGFSIIELPALGDAKVWAEPYAAILGDNEVDVRVVAGTA